MFNLDQAIAEWRRQMTDGGVKDSIVLDELESHLREDVERQTRVGMEAKRAFESAAQRIGPASALKTEFKKSTVALVLEKLMIAAAVLVLAFGAFLSIVTLRLCYGTVTERLMGFVAMSLSFGIACAWPAVVSRLPVIQPRRKLHALQVASFLGGIAVSTFYVQMIVNRFGHYADGMLPACGFFAIFPIAVGLALAAGLERAARRTTEQITA